MNFTWRVTRIPAHEPPQDPEGDGSLFDEEVPVGQVQHLPSQSNPDADSWPWNMTAFYKPAGLRSSGRAPTRDEAKAETEAAYRAFCAAPGARDKHLAHTRERRDAGERPVQDGGRGDKGLIDDAAHV